MKKLIFILSTLLVSCADVPTTPSRFEGSGVRAEAPVGYTSTCVSNPEQEFCKP